MKERPVYLDLTQIKLPITALCSIIHRISGVLMILSLPILALLMVLLFRHEVAFDHWGWLAGSMVMKVIYLGMLWAWSYHVIAGLKHMVHDFSGCHSLKAVRLTSMLSLGLFALVAVFWVYVIGWY